MKKIIWELILTRKTTPLLFSALGRGIARAGLNAMHIWNGVATTVFLEKRSDKDMEKIHQNFLREIIANPNFGKKYFKKILTNSQKLKNICFSFYKKDISSFSNKRLFVAFDKIYFQLILDGASIFPVYFLKQKKMENPKDLLGKNFRYFPYNFQISLIFDLELEKFLKRKLKNKKKENQYLSILGASPYTTPILEEEKDLLKIVLRYKKDQMSKKKFHQHLEKHLENYAWIPTDFGFGRFWTIEDIKKRAQRLLKIDHKKRLKEIEGYSKNIISEKKAIIRELKIPKKIQAIIEFLGINTFLRLYRRYNWAEVFYYANPLFKEIQARINFNSLKDLMFCTYEEVKAGLIEGKKIDRNNIKRRKKKFVIYYTQKKIFYYANEKAEKFLDSQIFSGFSTKRINKRKKMTIKGTVACIGKITGTVKIVLELSDMKKVKKGDILVASETTPDLLPAMKKASAFVTDEGGLSCHAAIISREMNKPCIVGTKIGTKVLKDGDLVEVDAQGGIVKKIEK